MATFGVLLFSHEQCFFTRLNSYEMRDDLALSALKYIPEGLCRLQNILKRGRSEFMVCLLKENAVLAY